MTTAADLARTHAACFSHTRAWSEAEFSALLSASTTWLIGDATSFALLRGVADEAEILTLATHPDSHRQGRARAVLTEVDTKLRPSIAQVFLEVDETNQAACALYSACGYHNIGRRKNYYTHADGRRSDALILGKNLT